MSPFSPGPRPVGLPPELAWPVRVDDSGRAGPTRMQARGRAWRRTSRGLYVPSSTARSLEQRIVEAAAVTPAYGAVTGWAALRWWGGSWFDGTHGCVELPVTIALMDSSIRRQAGIAISEERLNPTEIQPHRGLRLTVPAYALLFEIRHLDAPDRALALAEMAAYDDLVSRDELAMLVARSAGWDGIGRGRTVVALMEENAWSPAEVTMRRVWVRDAGLPPPLPNRPVFDLQGRHLATPDLIDPVAGVVGEYDSEFHLDRTRRRRDLERDDRYRAVGLEPVVMVTGELADPWRFVGRLRAAYGRAARASASPRCWTIEQPQWWVPTETVAQRRALSAEQQAVWLRYRLRAG
jgi:hypothetical protein